MRDGFITLSLLTCLATQPHADDPGFAGEWRTSLGVVRFEQDGKKLTGKFVASRIPPVEGNVKGKTATLAFLEKNKDGKATLDLDPSGHSFQGRFEYANGARQQFDGWRPDPLASKQKPGRFPGLWLTSLGLMELKGVDAKLTGEFGLRGGSEISGDANGGHLDHRFKAFCTGKGWFDLADDGAKLDGAATDDGSNVWFAWKGRRAPEFARHAKLVPGKTIDGSTEGLLTYSIHVPEDFKAEDKRTWPTVVILHGSNMSAKAYVDTIAGAWPDVARDFLILGINGERPSDIGPDPSFNYSYVNYMGKSTYGGFPGTDRESPALVSEALAELKKVYPVKHYLVGGHSQGGYLTYSLLMNFPEMFAGAFPTSSEVMFQCEPDAFTDEALKKSQRRVPLAIVHGKNDPLVAFNSGRYASVVFGEAGWRSFRFFTHETAGHMFALLPVHEAIFWIETLASDDKAALTAFAEKRLKEKGYRDATSALLRLREVMVPQNDQTYVQKLARTIDDAAREGATRYLAKIKADKDGTWVDGFLTYRDEFEFADSAKDVMSEFAKLRAKHSKPAQDAFNEARKSFQQGRQDDGYAKYQEILDKYYASPLYRNVKTWVAERKK